MPDIPHEAGGQGTKEQLGNATVSSAGCAQSSAPTFRTLDAEQTKAPDLHKRRSSMMRTKGRSIYIHKHDAKTQQRRDHAVIIIQWYWLSVRSREAAINEAWCNGVKIGPIPSLCPKEGPKTAKGEEWTVVGSRQCGQDWGASRGKLQMRAKAGGMFIGETLYGMPYGQGIIALPNGATYSGTWKGGVWSNG
eukprot:5427101-Pleurochrysis_carterae.AAC.1